MVSNQQRATGGVAEQKEQERRGKRQEALQDTPVSAAFKISHEAVASVFRPCSLFFECIVALEGAVPPMEGAEEPRCNSGQRIAAIFATELAWYSWPSKEKTLIERLNKHLSRTAFIELNLWIPGQKSGSSRER